MDPVFEPGLYVSRLKTGCRKSRLDHLDTVNWNNLAEIPAKIDRYSGVLKEPVSCFLRWAIFWIPALVDSEGAEAFWPSELQCVRNTGIGMVCLRVLSCSQWVLKSDTLDSIGL